MTTAEHLRVASDLLRRLPDQKERAKKLASHLRTMGVVSGLLWLRQKEGDKGRVLVEALEQELGFRLDDLHATTNATCLQEVAMRLMPLVEALNLIARTEAR